MISHKQKFGQIILGPSDSAKEDYIRCAMKYFERRINGIEIVNLDQCSSIDKQLFTSDIRDEPFNEFSDVNGSSSICAYSAAALDNALGNSKWILNVFEGTMSPYFLINMSSSIDIMLGSSKYDELLKLLQKCDFIFVLMNIFPANFIKTPSDFIAARCSMLSMTFSIESGHYTVINIITDASLLNDENYKNLVKIINEDNENRRELFGKFECNESLAGLTGALFQFADETGPFTEINILDTDDENEAKSLFTYIDSLLNCDYANMDVSDDNCNEEAAYHKEDSNEEDDDEFFSSFKKNI